jgi:glycosyltransferase involved in cell wall biosynthesis
VRNLYQLNALIDCDLAITSSEWQRSQFPSPFSARIRVLPDGVDTQLFSPCPGTSFVAEGCDLSRVRELVTFSGRSLDPARGFPQFYRCLPRLLSARPDCHVLILLALPEYRRSEDVTAARAALAAIQAEAPTDHRRVHILPFQPYEHYRDFLRASTVHVYLTAPCALSSGLLEAMSCGCLVIGSNTPPVREVIEHGRNGFLCDFWDTQMLADMLTTLLNRSREMDPIRQAARETIMRDYDLRRTLPLQHRILLEEYGQRPAPPSPPPPTA